ncbi:MAG: hypothetical protein GWN58_31245 [Anaerolineae bacterium]|nr:hypothetical protein [Anaerolineae bacterium]
MPTQRFVLDASHQGLFDARAVGGEFAAHGFFGEPPERSKPATDGREVGLDLDDSSERVLRGVAWYHPAGMHDNLSATARINVPPDHVSWYFGLCCAHGVD